MVCPNRPCDPESADTGSAVPIIDIVYVDLTVLIVAASPTSLRQRLYALLTSLIKLFTPWGLAINWKSGKTEIMLKFHGIGSVAEYERLRSDHGFGVSIQGTDMCANVVLSYKHLGGVLQSNLSHMMFVDRRASCAMTNCVPIVGRVFSSPSKKKNERRFDMPAFRFPRYDREHSSDHNLVASTNFLKNFLDTPDQLVNLSNTSFYLFVLMWFYVSLYIVSLHQQFKNYVSSTTSSQIQRLLVRLAQNFTPLPLTFTFMFLYLISHLSLMCLDRYLLLHPCLNL